MAIPIYFSPARDNNRVNKELVLSLALRMNTGCFQGWLRTAFFGSVFLGMMTFPACNSRQKALEMHDSAANLHDTIKYAHGFTITRINKNIRLLKVFNPWEGARGIEYKYLLCPTGTSIPDSLKTFFKIFTPVKRVVCLSTTHIALLSFIGEVNSIVGVSGPNYISDSLTRKRFHEGKIFDIGYDQALNYELIVSLKPDVVFAYGIQGETAGQYKKLEALGIKVVLNGEYLEDSPLGKFEWVKFMAAFFNKQDEVTKKFSVSEQEYLKYSGICDHLKDKPTILSGLPWKGAWYVPGGNSYGAKMISDAGGIYLWKENSQRESLPLNFEKVMDRANQATIWINTGNANTLNEILN